MSSQPESSESNAANTTVLGGGAGCESSPTQHTCIVDNFDGTPKEVQPIGGTTTDIEGQNLNFKNLLSLKPSAGSCDPYGTITPEHRREYTGVLDGPPTSACQRIHSIYDQLWKENRLLGESAQHQDIHHTPTETHITFLSLSRVSRRFCLLRLRCVSLPFRFLFAAQVNTVLLYVVPRLRRDGGVNNQWWVG
eukprot:GHVN01099833.1.p1 GENE.GHVN01099833.1~~GHVN01099833.1.p1  ORF type:complete len:193 (-),score=19.64 GHVN01099833.1:549-1127(-)